MGAFQCPTCGKQRSGHRNSDCSVCWLIKDFREEHAEGLHKKPTHGCPECEPVLARQIAREANRVRRASDATMRKAQARMDELGVLYGRPTRASSTAKPAAVRQVATSHAGCDHERTPKARAKCRAARRLAANEDV
jgi:hypothetical protein